MTHRSMSREAAEDLIQRLLDLEFVEDEEREGEVIAALQRGLVCPDIITLIYHTTPELTPTEIVDQAMAYEPIAL
ncbi:e9imm peptide [Streptomyces sp. NPDC058255]|uniref:e9imm peptide n=1 Tax=Streptomyces sp. NPDC058255 TaxID=3346407 RepID=UPI0036EFA9AD